ncbi:MAG: hypothetical protein AAFY78_20485 [Cyanobacteria bacterium J06648_16]
MPKLIKNNPSKLRTFLCTVVLSFSCVVSAYWTFTESGLARPLIEMQASTFDGYYYIKLTFALVWLAVMVVCLPLAFGLGWLCDRLEK